MEMLQDTKTAPVSAGLKSFVDVARSGEKITKYTKGPSGERRERLFFSCFGFCRSFIFNKLTESASLALCSEGNFSRSLIS
jgi:hypothetical protein